MPNIDYSTFWPEEEAAPPQRLAAVRPRRRAASPRRSRRQQRGTLYLRDCGNRGLYYAGGGWLFGFFGAAILLGLLTLLHSILSALF